MNPVKRAYYRNRVVDAFAFSQPERRPLTSKSLSAMRV